MEFWYAPNFKSFFSSWPFGRHAYQKVTVFRSFFSCASWDRNSETFFSTFIYGSQILLRHFVCAFLNFLICQNLRRLAITTDPILLHITHRPPSMNICKSSVQELSLCCFPFNLFSWCSGYHIRLTRGRSPVRSRAKTYFPFFSWLLNILIFSLRSKICLFIADAMPIPRAMIAYL